MTVERIKLETVDSTNNEAKRRVARGDISGLTWITADYQTAGRGRQGKSFHSPAGAGIYGTLVIPMGCPITGQVTITARAAVAVAKAIEEITGLTVEIKWVNDIYVSGRKVAGILCEAVNNYDSRTMEWAIIGVGINLAATEWPEELKTIAISLEEATGGWLVPEEMYRELDASVPEYLEQFVAETDDVFMDYYRQHSNVLGREISFFVNSSEAGAADMVCYGLATDIDDSGALIVELPDGTKTVLNSGEITLRVGNADEAEGIRNTGAVTDTDRLCPCCMSHVNDGIGKYDICPVCGWEDDPVQRRDEVFTGGANEMSLREAKEAYNERRNTAQNTDNRVI